ALQIGMDVYRKEDSEGRRDHAGFYLGAGRIEAQVDHYTGTRAGQNTIDGYSLGLYWTHFGASGWYLDGIAQATLYNARARSADGFHGLKTNGVGIALSIEGGYPFKFENNWVVEPQAQLVYQSIWLDKSGDAAARVRFDDVESLTGRLAVRVAKTWSPGGEPAEGEKRRLMTAWVRAGLWHEFLGAPRTSFSSADGFVPFRSKASDTWASFTLGVTGQISRTGTLYVSGGYDIGLNGKSHALNGKMGMRFHW
ncbi:autotransporter outer membrane beta-barrel domain-containing protein, partial [Reyranella sp. CPCC 100927]|uniref:autotransporter domain-containing protein n=1 Tax=Reyranella sp. CPCC 100927 TaxID=2599616 RepID=UPI0011B43C67